MYEASRNWNAGIGFGIRLLIISFWRGERSGQGKVERAKRADPETGTGFACGEAVRGPSSPRVARVVRVTNLVCSLLDLFVQRRPTLLSMVRMTARIFFLMLTEASNGDPRFVVLKRRERSDRSVSSQSSTPVCHPDDGSVSDGRKGLGQLRDTRSRFRSL